jgi:YidC/Oxa1 family membrane protein insertase
VITSDQSARFAAVAPAMAEIKAEYEKDSLVNPNEARMKHMMALQKIKDAADISYAKMTLPSLVQLFIGLGTFRFLNGLSTTPGLGLTSQGALWFSDLTIADPFFVLPALMSLSTWVAFKVGIVVLYSLLLIDLR